MKKKSPPERFTKSTSVDNMWCLSINLFPWYCRCVAGPALGRLDARGWQDLPSRCPWCTQARSRVDRLPLAGFLTSNMVISTTGITDINRCSMGSHHSSSNNNNKLCTNNSKCACRWTRLASFVQLLFLRWGRLLFDVGVVGMLKECTTEMTKVCISAAMTSQSCLPKGSTKI